MTLKEKFGTRYHLALLDEMEWRDSRFTFLHGLLGEKRLGTCPSLPVLVVAIGRRLGYPLFLVRTYQHLFSRWDDPATGVRFNIEYNGTGMENHTDERYLKAPRPWPEPILRYESRLPAEQRNYLRSLTPTEEFAEFLCQRGHCLEDNGRLGEAMTAYDRARAYAPEYPGYMDFFTGVCNRFVVARGLIPQAPLGIEIIFTPEDPCGTARIRRS